jgi:phage terminase large subunit-like protein
MTETQFLVALSQTTTAYKWTVDNKQIVGTAKNGKTRGKKFDPVTAVCRSVGKGTYASTCRGKKQAASKIGLTDTLAKNVSSATQAKSNRGNYQVLRGRMRQVLDV